MINLSRREFITSLLGLGLVTLSTHKVGAASIFSKNEITVFFEVYRAWLKGGLGDPNIYITKRTKDFGTASKLDADSINKLSEKDFCDGLLFEIDGLVLSRFEAAIIARNGKLIT